MMPGMLIVAGILCTPSILLIVPGMVMIMLLFYNTMPAVIVCVLHKKGKQV